MPFAIMFGVLVFGTTVNALPADNLADFNAKVVAQIEKPVFVAEYKFNK